MYLVIINLYVLYSVFSCTVPTVRVFYYYFLYNFHYNRRVDYNSNLLCFLIQTNAHLIKVIFNLLFD